MSALPTPAAHRRAPRPGRLRAILFVCLSLGGAARAHPHTIDELLTLPFARLLELGFTPAPWRWCPPGAATAEGAGEGQ